MKPLSRGPASFLLAILVLLVCATRFHHFGDLLHLPDASMAAFFLGGLYVRRHLAFLGMATLALAVDWVSIELAGVSDFCVTPAYSFLLPAYAVLWYGGRLQAGRVQASAASLSATAGVALLACVVSFAISNGAFYWLGDVVAAPGLPGHWQSFAQWAPLFLRTAMAYVAAGLATHTLVAWVLRTRAAGNLAGT